MKTIKKTVFIVLISFIMAGFSQCSSAQKLQDKAPVEITDIYYQRWASGIRDGGAGVDLYFTVKESKIKLDSAYFRGRVTSLSPNLQKSNQYVGRFVTVKENYDIVMSSEANEEYGNKLPTQENKIPFKLDEHECVISYKEGNKIKYFKIEGIKERQVKEFPMGRKQ